jgi:hypothetical protein
MVWRVFDLFSGVGGYTCGALQALADASDECDRYEMHAIDCEIPVLAALGANVRAHEPGARYTQRNVRLGTDDFELPDEDGATMHRSQRWRWRIWRCVGVQWATRPRISNSLDSR